MKLIDFIYIDINVSQYQTAFIDSECIELTMFYFIFLLFTHFKVDKISSTLSLRAVSDIKFQLVGHF